jgi:ribosomal protein S18 acetylase RimI-like enzyme
MAVAKQWRCSGIGSQLIDRITRFASIKGFASVELVTTECHAKARSLYEKKGFEVKQLYHKKFFHLSGVAITMYLMQFRTRPYRGSALDL